MNRRPNPWIAIPAVVTGLLGGALGWMVTTVSCRQESRSCSVLAGVIALVSFLAVTIGVTLLLALVFRSLAEWRQQSERR
ncbi:MAG TPA: hypothetical protein VF246_07640 [Acidimicrobiia bacterium]